MTSRFTGPWRIAEFPNGFAVYDATGRQLGFFYGRADPNMAGHAGFLTIGDARQSAVDFARLPELLNQTSGRSEIATSTEDDKLARLPELLKQTSDRSEVATSPEDDKLAKLETNRSPQDVPETSRLPRAAQLSVITVTGSPLAKAPTTIRRSIPSEPERRRSTRMLRRPSDPPSIRTKFLIVIAIAVAALPAGYLFFGNSDPPERPQRRPQTTTNRLSVEFSPLREAQAPAAIPSVEFLPLQAPTAAAVGTYAESRIEPEVQTAPLQPTVPLDIRPIENGIEARPPQTLPQKEGQSFTPSQDASTCFPSALAVRQNYPGGWPSWTLKAPGHEGARCWYPATRTTAHDHRSEMRKKETAAGVKKDDDTSVAAIVAKKDDDTSKAAAAVKLDVDSAGGSTEMAGARLMEPANLAVQRESRLKHDAAEVPNGVIKPSANASETNSGAAQGTADREPAPSALSNDGNFYRERGVAAYRSGDFLGAIGNFDEAIRLNPNDAQSYNIRGNVWDELGIYERALADYDEAIRIDPNNPAVFHDRAILWYRKGALDEALIDLDRAIRFSFADANVYCDRGLVWYQKGRHERAIADFNQAIKLDPNFTAAYINRGLILHSNREFTVAFADSKAIRVDPNIFDVTKRTKLHP